MKPGKPTVADKIRTSPLYKSIVKAVGYGQPANTDVITRLKCEIEHYGQQAVSDAAGELLDYEVHGGKHYARIKPELHVHCRMLLGPMPSEWDSWWLNADGTERKGKPKVWPPKLPGPPKVQRPPDHTKEEEELQRLPFRMLTDRLHAARHKARAFGQETRDGQRAREELDRLEAEYARRRAPAPEAAGGGEPTAAPSEDEGLRRLPLRVLADRLHESRQHARTLSPRSEEGKKALAEVETIEAEYRRRELVIPETPDTLPMKTKRSRSR